ncbi:MAG: hypothetical protein JO249_16235 [Acidobacteria bacterium]|nr:hypothetical protein [Acidobacteriota bacterium]
MQAIARNTDCNNPAIRFPQERVDTRYCTGIRSRIGSPTIISNSINSINILSIFFRREFVCSKLLLLTNNRHGGKPGI